MTKQKYDGPSSEEILVENLISLMEKGAAPWRKDWDPIQSTHRNFVSGHAYRGGNIILLTMGMYIGGYSSPLWCGFHQAKTAKLKVKKGVKSTRILKPMPVTTETELPDGQIEQASFVRYSIVPVFNIDDMDGDDKQKFIDKHMESVDTPKRDHERLEAAEQILSPWPVGIDYGQYSPCYVSTIDRIKMPSIEKFHSREGYYATRAHEMLHSTGHKSRLDRDLGGKFGSKRYAKEELVAELGAVLLCNRLQISTQFENHSAYLSSWIEVLKEEPKFLLQALTYARKGADLIYAPPAEPEGV